MILPEYRDVYKQTLRAPGLIQRVLNAGNSAKPVWKVLALSIVCDIDLVAIVRDKQQWLKNKQVSLSSVIGRAF